MERKIIKLKKDNETGETYIDLKEFEGLYDISQVDHYSVEESDGVIIIQLFDKNNKLLKPLNNSGNV